VLTNSKSYTTEARFLSKNSNDNWIRYLPVPPLKGT
jgi:hypothetical protein